MLESFKRTYHRPLEGVAVQLEFLQGFALVGSTADDAGHLAGANIFENGLDLVGSGKILGDVELELGTLGMSLSSVIAGLVLGCTGRGIGGSLLEDCCNPLRSWRASLVEESDDVESLMLREKLAHP